MNYSLFLTDSDEMGLMAMEIAKMVKIDIVKLVCQA